MRCAAGSRKKEFIPAQFLESLKLSLYKDSSKKLLFFFQTVKVNLQFSSGGLF